VIALQQLDALDPQQMRQALLTLLAEVAAKDELLARHAREATFKQALIDKLTHEVANLRRLKYAVTSEKFCAGMSAVAVRQTRLDLEP
jgi:transposase